MIFKYEQELINYFKSRISGLNQALYASEENLLLTMESVVDYPALFYTRLESDWLMAKPLSIIDPSNYTKKKTLFHIEQTYQANLVVEKQREAQELAAHVRAIFDDCPYIVIGWPTKQDQLKVQLRLLYIKIEDVRQKNNKQGSLRTVKFQWTSQLFIEKTQYQNTVKSIGITINNDNKINVDYE